MFEARIWPHGANLPQVWRAASGVSKKWVASPTPQLARNKCYKCRKPFHRKGSATIFEKAATVSMCLWIQAIT